MALNKRSRNVAYGLVNPLQSLAQAPIISQRAPTTSDKANLGTLWIDEPSNGYYILTSISSNSANWVAQTLGAGVVTSLTVSNNAAIGGNLAVVGTLGVDGTTTFTGNVIVNGDLQANGDWDLASNSAITFVSHSDTAPAMAFEVDGGTAATMQMVNSSGTSATSLSLQSTDGGIYINAVNSVSNEAIHLDATAGGIHFDAGLASTVEVTGAGEDLNLTANGGSVVITGTESGAGAITLSASGAAGTIVATGVGGVSISATNNAVSIESGTGAMNIATAASANSTTIGNATGASSVTVNVGTGALNLGTTATAHATNVGSTTAGSTLVLNTPATVPVLTPVGVQLGTTGGPKILFGTGAPAGVQPKGSLYIRTDGATGAELLYVESDGLGTWLAFTAA